MGKRVLAQGCTDARVISPPLHPYLARSSRLGQGHIHGGPTISDRRVCFGISKWRMIVSLSLARIRNNNGYARDGPLLPMHISFGRFLVPFPNKLSSSAKALRDVPQRLLDAQAPWARWWKSAIANRSPDGSAISNKVNTPIIQSPVWTISDKNSTNQVVTGYTRWQFWKPTNPEGRNPRNWIGIVEAWATTAREITQPCWVSWVCAWHLAHTPTWAGKKEEEKEFIGIQGTRTTLSSPCLPSRPKDPPIAKCVPGCRDGRQTASPQREKATGYMCTVQITSASLYRRIGKTINLFQQKKSPTSDDRKGQQLGN